MNEFGSSAWSYHRQHGGKDEWLTPKELIWQVGEGAFGEMFDLDPCAPVVRPWPMAKNHFTIKDNGLILPWHGRVWCNPPYRNAAAWLKRCAGHGNAMALVFARTDTKMFAQTVWGAADAVAFIIGRITFHHVDGKKAKWTGGGPSALVAYGDNMVDALEIAIQDNELNAHLVYLSAGERQREINTIIDQGLLL